MRVTTWHLEQLRAPEADPLPVPDGMTIVHASGIDPEYLRFLYALIGGPWRWTDRLRWSRARWERELAQPGSEVWVLYGEGVPLGYIQLAAQVLDSTEVEILYFGLAEAAIGRGAGKALLDHGIRAAWSLPSRHALPDVTRVWVHTCSLDSPAALSNYRARGLVLAREEVADESVPSAPYGSWASIAGAVLPNDVQSREGAARN